MADLETRRKSVLYAEQGCDTSKLPLMLRLSPAGYSMVRTMRSGLRSAPLELRVASP
jgi:hypothetical protein